METSYKRRFCSNCGAGINEGAAFCSNCGSSTENNESSSIVKNDKKRNIESNTHDDTLEELQKLYNWFSQKGNQYKQIDYYSAILPRFTRVNKKALLIFGIIILNISIIIFAAARKSSVTALGFVALIVGLGMIGGFIASQIVRSNRYKQYQARIESLADELAEHYCQYGDCPLTFENTYPNIIMELYELVKGGRADTIKEALNIRINDYRMNEMTNLARQTAASAQQAARNAGAAAVFSAIGAFKRR